MQTYKEEFGTVLAPDKPEEDIVFKVGGTYTWGGRGSCVTILSDFENENKNHELITKHLGYIPLSMYSNFPLIGIRWWKSSGSKREYVVVRRDGFIGGNDVMTQAVDHNSIPHQIQEFFKEAGIKPLPAIDSIVKKEVENKPLIEIGKTFKLGDWYYTVVDNFSKKEFDSFGLKLEVNHSKVGKDKNYPFTFIGWGYKGCNHSIFVDNCDVHGNILEDTQKLKDEVSVNLPQFILDILKTTSEPKETPKTTPRPEKAFYTIITDQSIIVRCLDSNLRVCKWDRETIPDSAIGYVYHARCIIKPFDITFEDYLRVNGWKNTTIDNDIAELKKKVIGILGCQKDKLFPYYENFLKMLQAIDSGEMNGDDSYLIEAIDFMIHTLNIRRSKTMDKITRGAIHSNSSRWKSISEKTEKLLELLSKKSKG